MLNHTSIYLLLLAFVKLSYSCCSDTTFSGSSSSCISHCESTSARYSFQQALL